MKLLLVEDEPGLRQMLEILFRREGYSVVSAPGCKAALDAIASAPRSVIVVNDRERVPDVAVLQAAKAAGARIAFSSGGDTIIDEARLKARLQAIRLAGLGSTDLWLPGRN